MPEKIDKAAARAAETFNKVMAEIDTATEKIDKRIKEQRERLESYLENDHSPAPKANR